MVEVLSPAYLLPICFQIRVELMPKITIRSAKAMQPKGKEYFLWDDELKGFGLRCAPSGRKVFVLQYRQDGRTRRMTLGPFGALTPDQARDLARKHRGEVAQGQDPSNDRQKQRRTPNVSALCDRFLEEHVKVRLAETTQREYASIINNYIRPRLGGLRVDAVTRTDVAELHHAMRDTPYHANRTRSVLSKMFNLAELWGLRPDGTNPTRHVPRYKETPKERFLSPEEIERLWRVLDARVAQGLESVHVATAFKLLMLTGCRRNEIKTLKWSYIRGDVIWLPNSKTGPRRVHLSASAVQLLSDLPRATGNEFVIVGEKEGQHATDLQRPWRRIREQAGINDVRIHDLRHTFASYAAMAGYDLPIIGRLLGHTQIQTTARYAHLADAPVRRAADEVDDLLSQFIAPTNEEPTQLPLKLVTNNG
jgi:integrase